MNDRTVSATTAAAVLLWTLGLTLVLLDLFGHVETGELGIYATGGAMVLNIRSFFCQQREREREAYDLGRETVRRLH